MLLSKKPNIKRDKGILLLWLILGLVLAIIANILDRVTPVIEWAELAWIYSGIGWGIVRAIYYHPRKILKIVGHAVPLALVAFVALALYDDTTTTLLWKHGFDPVTGFYVAIPRSGSRQQAIAIFTTFMVSVSILAYFVLRGRFTRKELLIFLLIFFLSPPIVFVLRWWSAPNTHLWNFSFVDYKMYKPVLKDTEKLRSRYLAFSSLSDGELNGGFLSYGQFGKKLYSDKTLSDDERRHSMMAREAALYDLDVGLTYEKRSYWSYLGFSSVPDFPLASRVTTQRTTQQGTAIVFNEEEGSVMPSFRVAMVTTPPVYLCFCLTVWLAGMIRAKKTK